jgi:hypothetical protein
MIVLRKPERGLVGDASGAVAPGEPFGEMRDMAAGGMAI